MFSNGRAHHPLSMASKPEQIKTSHSKGMYKVSNACLIKEYKRPCPPSVFSYSKSWYTMQTDLIGPE